MRHLFGLLALAGLGACVSPGSSGTNLYASAPLTRAEEPVLYARDGTPVSGAPVEVESPGRARAVEGEESSRLYLLDLYQKAMDENEALRRELETTRAMLLSEQERSMQLDQALGQEVARGEAATEKARMLEEESRELSARLTTAQIRRLEAEKLLLEAKIQWDEQVLAGRQAGHAVDGMGAGPMQRAKPGMGEDER